MGPKIGTKSFAIVAAAIAAGAGFDRYAQIRSYSPETDASLDDTLSAVVSAAVAFVVVFVLLMCIRTAYRNIARLHAPVRRGGGPVGKDAVGLGARDASSNTNVPSTSTDGRAGTSDRSGWPRALIFVTAGAGGFVFLVKVLEGASTSSVLEAVLAGSAAAALTFGPLLAVGLLIYFIVNRLEALDGSSTSRSPSSIVAGATSKADTIAMVPTSDSATRDGMPIGAFLAVGSFFVSSLAVAVMSDMRRSLHEWPWSSEPTFSLEAQQTATPSPSGMQDTRGMLDHQGSPARASMQSKKSCDDDKLQTEFHAPRGLGPFSIVERPFLAPIADLKMEDAPEETTTALLGRTQKGDVAQTKRVDYTLYEKPVYDIWAPQILDLGGANRIWIAVAAPPNERAESGHVAAAMVRPDGSTSRLVGLCCEGGQWWPKFGNIAAPVRQPVGRQHIWSISGLRWMGGEMMWLGINDVTGDEPKPLGVFPWSGYGECAKGLRPGSECTDFAFELSDASYSGENPTTLTLTWNVWTCARFEAPSGDTREDPISEMRSAVFVLRKASFSYLGDTYPPTCTPGGNDCNAPYAPNFLEFYKRTIGRETSLRKAGDRIQVR